MIKVNRGEMLVKTLLLKEIRTALTSLGLLGVIATGFGLARKKKED